jgi:hypothetical protein
MMKKNVENTSFVITTYDNLLLATNTREENSVIPVNSEMSLTTISRSCSPLPQASHLKRKRSQSPKQDRKDASSKVSITHKHSRTMPAHSNSLNVRLVSPTIQGIAEASQILRGDKVAKTKASRSGVVVLPTERHYAFSCVVPFQRTSLNDVFGSKKTDTWSFLRRLKSGLHSNESTSKKFLTSMLPSIYLHSPEQSCHFLTFTKPKRFVYKTSAPQVESPLPLEGSIQEQKHTLTAVTFSESYEVLNRLSSAFWPGPVVIYAPIRTRRRKASTVSDTVEEGGTPSQNDNNLSLCSSSSSYQGSTSYSSLQSLSSDYNEKDQLGSIGQTNTCKLPASFPDVYDEEDAIPILPSSVLTTVSNLLGKGHDSNHETHFVGMRCPSHPLTRRVLCAAYTSAQSTRKSLPSQESKGESSPSRANVSKVLKGAIVGFSSVTPQFSSPPKDQIINNQNLLTSSLPSFLMNSVDVCKSLESVPVSSLDDTQKSISFDSNGFQSGSAPTSLSQTVHVLNGEDQREMFNVPTCQYGQSPSVALVVDCSTRTVHILKDVPKEVDSTRQSGVQNQHYYNSFNVTVGDVTRALRHIKQEKENGKSGSVKMKVIATVLAKWNVVEKINYV